MRFSRSIVCIGAGYQLFAEPAVQTTDNFNKGSGFCCMQGPIQGSKPAVKLPFAYSNNDEAE